MRRALVPAILALCLGAAPAAATPLGASASYIVSVAGINVASVDIRLDSDGRGYGIDLDAAITGLGNWVARGTAGARSAGVLGPAALTSAAFGLETVSSDRFSVDVNYSGGEVTAFVVNPPLADHGTRVPIERSQLTGVNDPLAAFVLTDGELGPGLCQRRLRIFTGVERFDLQFSFAGLDEATSARTGYQGPVVLCRIDYQPISGHYSNSDVTGYLAASERILIWYAPLGDSGVFVPYRMLVGTAMGDMSVVLTRLQG